MEHKEEQKNPAEAKQEREKAILPIPCVGFDDWTVKQWFQKINEELDEFKQEVYACLDGGACDCRTLGDVDDEDRDTISEEAADTITAITSMLEAMGIDEGMRQEAQRWVNEKNRERGRIA